MNTVTDFTAGLLAGVTAAFARLLSAIPNIIGALILLVIGWIIAGIIGTLVTKICRAVHVDTVASRVGVNGFLAQSGSTLLASNIIGEIVKWVVRLVFIEMAAEQLGMPQISLIINSIIGFIPNIIVAMVILGIGAFLGQILGGIVRGAASEAKLGNGVMLAKLTSGAILAFAIIAALNELNVAPVVVDTLYIGLVAAVALALGLAFGLGGRETAARLAAQWTAALEDTAKKVAATTPAQPTLAPVSGSAAATLLNAPNR